MEKVTDELFKEEAINETLDQDLSDKVRKDLIRPLFINTVSAIAFAVVLFFIFDIKINDLENRLKNYTELEETLEKANKRLDELNTLTKLMDLNKLTADLDNKINVSLFKLEKNIDKNENTISLLNSSITSANEIIGEFKREFSELKKYDLNATKIDKLLKDLDSLTIRIASRSDYAKNNMDDIDTIANYISKVKDPTLSDIPTELVYQRVIDRLEKKKVLPQTEPIKEKPKAEVKPTYSTTKPPFELDSIVDKSVIIVYIPSTQEYIKLNIMTDSISDRFEVSSMNIASQEVVFYDKILGQSFIVKAKRQIKN